MSGQNGHQPLRRQSLRGSQLTPVLLQAMSDLRRSVMTMKAHIDKDADFQKFAAFCASCRHVNLFYDAAGQLAGMHTFAVRRGKTAAGKRYLLIIAEYGFSLPQYRGHPALPMSLFPTAWHLLREWRGGAIWFGGIGYPAGLLVIDKLLGPLWLNSDPGLPPMARTMLDLLIDIVAGKNRDQANGIVVMPTIPPPMPPRWQAYADARPLYRRYVAHCPQWRQGFGMAGVVQVKPLRAMWRAMRNAMRRRSAA